MKVNREFRKVAKWIRVIICFPLHSAAAANTSPIDDDRIGDINNNNNPTTQQLRGTNYYYEIVYLLQLFLKQLYNNISIF